MFKFIWCDSKNNPNILYFNTWFEQAIYDNTKRIPAPPPSGGIQSTSFASDPARMNGETRFNKVSSSASGNWDDFGDFTGPVSTNSSNNTQTSKPSGWTTF